MNKLQNEETTAIQKLMGNAISIHLEYAVDKSVIKI